MLVMPFRVFRAQRRIMKSTKQWRDKARKNGGLIIYEDGSSKIVIFVSHTWWDRDFKDETNDPNDVYDHGAPDHQGGAKKDLKWRIICDGVQRLIERDGLNEDDVHLWIDWQSIYQDDKEEKLKGVKSLIQYATLCEYMLVPTEEETLTGDAATYPENIPGYGTRGWCRIEYFVYSLLAEMQERVVRLHAIQLDGTLNPYPQVKVEGEQYMPSGGDLSNPDDKALVKSLEDQMVEAYGNALVQAKCKAAGGETVDLSKKMIRPVHVDALFAAVERYKVAVLKLDTNQLGATGAVKLAAALKTNATVTSLSLGDNRIGDEGATKLAAILNKTKLTNLNLGNNRLGPVGGAALAKGLKGNTTLQSLDLEENDIGIEGACALAAVLKKT